MLTPTPDWRIAPPWACYVAQDPSGCWWWYECRPVAGESGNWHTSQLGTRIQRAAVQPNWRNTLQSRPVAVWTYPEDVE